MPGDKWLDKESCSEDIFPKLFYYKFSLDFRHNYKTTNEWRVTGKEHNIGPEEANT